MPYLQYHIYLASLLELLFSEASKLKYATGREAERVKPTVHLHTRHKLEAVRWNPNNQDEVF